MAKTTEKSTEYYKRKAEIAERRLEKAEREKDEIYAQMKALVNDFAKRFDCPGIYMDMGVHNLYVALSDVCRTHGRGELDYPTAPVKRNNA